VNPLYRPLRLLSLMRFMQRPDGEYVKCRLWMQASGFDLCQDNGLHLTKSKSKSKSKPESKSKLELNLKGAV
jgi:hypothetical protein